MSTPPTQRQPQPGPGAPPERVDPARLVGRIASGDSAARRLLRVASRTLTSNGASRELAELVIAAQRPVTTGRRIAVTSVRGGAGKSTVAALLASVYAARRPDAVLATDADPDGGSLTWRLGVSGRGTLATLAARLLAARSGDLRGLEHLLPRTETGLWVLPGGAPGQPRLARDVTRALSRLFAVCVTDCGRGMDSPATVQVLSEAHAVVVVAPATPDGVRTTHDALGQVAGSAQAASLSRVIVALSRLNSEGRTALRGAAAREAFAHFDIPVVMLPYDRHLAAAATITPSRIGEAVLVEATRLAGYALARARDL
ncbi:MAG: MinD/ParA family ATP-binding protein [Pseudonocardiaceae bacterium]